MISHQLSHMSHLLSVVEDDLSSIKEKEVGSEGRPGYRGSWKKRGGVGAFMMLCRKWDRLETFVEDHGWDIFESLRVDDREEGVLDDLRDLRRYLILVEAHMRAAWADEEPK